MTSPATLPATVPPPQVPAPKAEPLRAGPASRPVAGPARMRRRHWGVLLSFFLIVLAPLMLAVGYLTFFARDQYASTVGFTLRQEELASASALAGGLAQFFGGGGSGGASNARVLYEYLQSPGLVERIDAALDLRGHYSAGWPADPVYSIWPGATIEELTRFWLRTARISFDEGSGLMSIEVRARDPATAQRINEFIVAESQSMINELNQTARADAMRYADADLAEAVTRLRAAREALTSFRATTQILDPAADLQGRMGILTSLQAQLAQALIDLDLLAGITDESDPRRRQLERRIEVIRARLNEERRTFAAQDVTTTGTDYPTLLSRYEGLTVDLEVAEITYRTAQASHDAARARAERQTLYLATYIRPTLAQKSEYPQRLYLSVLAGFFLVMLWSVLVLVYYSLRDRG